MCPALMLTLLLTGCSVVSEGEAWRAATYPPDFRLSFEVTAPPGEAGEADEPQPEPVDAMRQPQRYVVEADRTLRAAVGRAVGAGVGGQASDPTYPPVTARLSPEAMRRLWTLTRATLDEGAAAADEEGNQRGRVRYRWSVWADHRVTRRVGRPASSPAAGRLLDELARLAYAREASP